MTLSNKEFEKIIRYYNNGFSIRQIAKKIKRDKNTINKYIKVHRKQQVQPLEIFQHKFFMERPPVFTSSQTWNIIPIQKLSESYRRREQAAQKRQFEDKHLEFNMKLFQLEMKMDALELQTKKHQHRQQMDKITKENLRLINIQNEQHRKQMDFHEKISEKVEYLNKLIFKQNQEVQKMVDNIPMLFVEEMKKIYALERDNENITPNPIHEETKNNNTFIQTDNQINIRNYQNLSNISMEKKKNDLETEKETQNGETEKPLDVVYQILITELVKFFVNYRNFQYSTYSKVPKNTPEYWYNLCEFIKNK